MTFVLFVRKIFAFWKRDLLESLGYPMPFAIEAGAIFFRAVTFFFIAKFLGAAAGGWLARYGGGDYFPYVLTGIALAGCQSTGLSGFAAAIHKEIGMGTLESILLTPTSLNVLLAASALWHFLFAALRILFYLGVGCLLFRVDFSGMNAPAAAASIVLTMTSLMGLGMMSAAFILIYKKGDPVSALMSGLSRLLSGVYFPIQMLPAWMGTLSFFLPLTYGLEALRKSLLAGAGIAEIGPELAALAVFSLLFLPLGVLLFNLAAKKARQDGTLAFA